MKRHCGRPFLRIFLGLAASAAWAQEGLESLLGPPSAYEPRFRMRYGLSAQEAMVDDDLKLAGLVYREGPHRVRVDASLQTFEWVRGPEKILYNPGGGLSYSNQSAQGGAWGLWLQHNSPSDKPYHSMEEVNLSGTYFYKMPRSGANAAFFFLNYANHRGFAQKIPLPLISYFYLSPDRKWSMLLGMPFFVNYRFHPKAWARISLLIPSLVGAEVGTQLNERWALKARGEWTYASFLLAERKKPDEQFYYESKRLVLGAEAVITRTLTASLEGGWAFDRRFFTAEGFFTKKKFGVERLKASPFVQVQLATKL